MVSLNKHRPGGEPGSRYVGHARIIEFHGVQHREVIHARGIRYEIELIGYSELNIAVRVAEQLSQLGLNGRQPYDSGSHFREEQGSSFLGFRSCAADHLRQRLQFL